MAAQFVLDEHISPDVAEGCRAKGVDVKSLAELKLLEADDLPIFRAAIESGRIIVTYNTGDFARLYGEMLRETTKIPGVVFVNSRTIFPNDIGGLVKALVRLASLIEKGEVDATGGIYLNR